jgi:hypothetical protein
VELPWLRIRIRSRLLGRRGGAGRARERVRFRARQSRLKYLALGRGQLQAVAEALHGVPAGLADPAAFQIPEGPYRKPGEVRERLLGELPPATQLEEAIA